MSSDPNSPAHLQDPQMHAHSFPAQQPNQVPPMNIPPGYYLYSPLNTVLPMEAAGQHGQGQNVQYPVPFDPIAMRFAQNYGGVPNFFRSMDPLPSPIQGFNYPTQFTPLTLPTGVPQYAPPPQQYAPPPQQYAPPPQTPPPHVPQQPIPPGIMYHQLPLQFSLAPPPHQTEHYAPAPGCATSRRLVLEQLREDQSVRVPWGWDPVAEDWILIERFKNGLPTWPFHIFWGKYNPDGGEVVRVSEERQVFFYKQIEFLCSLKEKYLFTMARRPEPSKNIEWTEKYPFVGKPTLPPFEISQQGEGVRYPDADEYLPTDAIPLCWPVIKPPEDKTSVDDLDLVLEAAYNHGKLFCKPPQYSSRTSFCEPQPRMTAAYAEMQRTETRQDQGATEDELSDDANGINSVPTTESCSALLTAIGIVSSSTEPSTSHEHDPEVVESKELSVPSDLNTAVSAQLASSTTVPPLQPVPSRSTSSTISVFSTQKSSLSLRTVWSKKDLSMTDILTAVTSSKSSISVHRETDSSEGVQTTQSGSVTPPVDEETRALEEAERLNEQLAGDVILKLIVETSDEIWANHIENQTLIRNNTNIGNLSFIMEQVWYFVFDSTCDWNAKTLDAQSFAQQQVVANRQAGNRRKYFMWQSVINMFPLSTVLVQDICYLMTQNADVYKRLETRWFHAVFHMDSLTTARNLPTEVVAIGDRVWLELEMSQRLAVYVERQAAIRDAAEAYDIEALGCTPFAKLLVKHYRTYKANWNALSARAKEIICERLFQLSVGWYQQHVEMEDQEYELSEFGFQLIRKNSKNAVLGFDAYTLDHMISTTAEEDRWKLILNYFLEIYGGNDTSSTRSEIERGADSDQSEKVKSSNVDSDEVKTEKSISDDGKQAGEAKPSNEDSEEVRAEKSNSEERLMAECIIQIPAIDLDPTQAAKIDKFLEKSLNYYLLRQQWIRKLTAVRSIDSLGLRPDEIPIIDSYIRFKEDYDEQSEEYKKQAIKFMFYFLHGDLMEARRAAGIVENPTQRVENYTLAKAFRMLQDSDSPVAAFDSFLLNRMYRTLEADQRPEQLADWYYHLVFEHEEGKVEAASSSAN